MFFGDTNKKTEASNVRDETFKRFKSQNFTTPQAAAHAAEQALQKLCNDGYGTDVEISPLIKSCLVRAQLS